MRGAETTSPRESGSPREEEGAAEKEEAREIGARSEMYNEFADT